MISRDEPVSKGNALLFHPYKGGKLVSVKKSDVVMVRRLTGIEAFRAHPDKYHAVITDMTMPQMNGINLSKELLEIRGNLPILLCTGFSDQANEKKARAAGVRGRGFQRRPRCAGLAYGRG
jgi:CheY-like chemotaxis protein